MPDVRRPERWLVAYCLIAFSDEWTPVIDEAELGSAGGAAARCAPAHP